MDPPKVKESKKDKAEDTKDTILQQVHYFTHLPTTTFLYDCCQRISVMLYHRLPRIPVTGTFDDLDQQAENEFQQKCREFAMYQPVERTTLDGEWTEEELKSDIYDVCVEVMTDKVLSQYKYRALRDSNLLKLQYMAEHIADQIDDVIELYNKEYVISTSTSFLVAGLISCLLFVFVAIISTKIIIKAKISIILSRFLSILSLSYPLLFHRTNVCQNSSAHDAYHIPCCININGSM